MRIPLLFTVGCAFIGLKLVGASALVKRGMLDNVPRDQLPNYYPDLCERYKFDPNNGFMWNYEGTLNYDDGVDQRKNHLYRVDWKRVKMRHNGGKKISRGYMYTFKAGTGLTAKSNTWMVVERSDKWGQGFNLQFRFDFMFQNKIIEAFWMKPNSSCSIESDQPSAAFDEVAIQARIFPD